MSELDCLLQRGGLMIAVVTRQCTLRYLKWPVRSFSVTPRGPICSMNMRMIESLSARGSDKYG